MPGRSYEQWCPIAVALDRVGDRWTLLVMRELTFGPQRFTDLRRHLPGIAPNLLTERLRDLEAEGLVEQQELPPPAARTVYALTEEGRAIRPVLQALARFGLSHLPDEPTHPIRPATAVHGLLAPRFDPAAAADVHLVVRFEVDGEEVALALDRGRLRRAKPEEPVDVRVRTSAVELARIARDGSKLRDALAGGAIEVEAGKRHLPALERAFALR